jgi:hypothetical protein
VSLPDTTTKTAHEREEIEARKRAQFKRWDVLIKFFTFNQQTLPALVDVQALSGNNQDVTVHLLDVSRSFLQE